MRVPPGSTITRSSARGGMTALMNGALILGSGGRGDACDGVFTESAFVLNEAKLESRTGAWGNGPAIRCNTACGPIKRSVTWMRMTADAAAKASLPTRPDANTGTRSLHGRRTGGTRGIMAAGRATGGPRPAGGIDSADGRESVGEPETGDGPESVDGRESAGRPVGGVTATPG